jgi:peptidoglycan hydrolase CwlO-like protein
MKIMIALLCFLMVSCKESDKEAELRAQHDKKVAELEDLRAELDEIREENAKLEIKDPSGDLEEIKKEMMGLEGEVASLEENIKALKAQAEEERRKLADYRLKYPVPGE